MEDLIKKLIDEGYLKTERIIQAFRKIKREDFLPPDMKGQAHLDIPLPLSFGQTISQPLTVAFMLELLQPKRGDKVLDVGAGSGWQTALLAEIVGDDGSVYAIERVPALERFGRKNISKYGFKNIVFICGDGTKEFKQGNPPYDRIIVAAASRIGIPDIYIKHLKVGGRLVIPVGQYEQDMVVVDKLTENRYREQRHPGFQFVPLIPKKWEE